MFPVLDQQLTALLRALAPAAWQRPTLARQWTVKDVAARLLDGNLRTLSMLCDGHFDEAPDDPSYAGVVGFLNRLNADWVRAARRLSPPVLIELLAQLGAEYTAFLHTLDPWAPAAFAVGWAGESESQNWFHIARDYTEKWHHQQQICEAVGDTAELLTPQLFRPFLETVLRGLLHALQAVAAPAGTVLQVRIETSAGGVGQLEQEAEAWQLRSQVTGAALAAEVTLSPEVAWKLFTHALTPAQARSLALITGNEQLWAAVLQLMAVMA